MTIRSYTATAIALHWLIALLVACSATLGLYMVDLPFSPSKLQYYSWHKWIGVSIFIIAVVRALWRLTHAAPSMPPAMPHWERRAAAASHLFLYVLIIVIPLSGWLMSSALGVKTVYLGMLPLPDLVAKDKILAEQLKLVHAGLNWTLAVLVGLHVAAALRHHFVARDDVLARMLPLLRRSG